MKTHAKRIADIREETEAYARAYRNEAWYDPDHPMIYLLSRLTSSEAVVEAVEKRHAAVAKQDLTAETRAVILEVRALAAHRKEPTE